MMAEHVYAVDF